MTALSRARILLLRADEMTIGPMFWWQLRQAEQHLTRAGRDDIAEWVSRMLADMNANGLPEVIAATEGRQ